MIKISDKFIEGFSRCFDINASLRKWPDLSYDPITSDCIALRGDWENVGKEIENAARTEAAKLANRR